MERKTKEQLAAMSHEELESIILHMQDEMAAKDELNIRCMGQIERLEKMEQRLTLLMELLISWGVKTK